MIMPKVWQDYRDSEGYKKNAEGMAGLCHHFVVLSNPTLFSTIIATLRVFKIQCLIRINIHN